MPEVEMKKIVQQLIRFLLTIWLLILIYKGKNWARIVTIILAFVAVVGSIISMFAINQVFVLKIPFLIMTFVNIMAIYFFGFSKSFKAFATYQKMKGSEIENLSV